MRAAKVAVLVVCLCAGAGAVPVHAARPGRGASRGPNKNEAEGRRHARKANQLADVNKCKAAIPEYTKAIRLLKDPTLLFNRAECYRRTGEAQKAIADYRKFLVQLPAAPNRGQVENQIAALEKNPGRAVIALAPAAPAAPAVSPPVARVATPKPAAEPPPPIPPPPPAPAPSPPAAPVAEERQPAPPQEVPEREVAPPSLPRAPPPEPAPVETPGPMALVNTKPTSAADTGSQSGSYWWIWVLGAVVLAGAGAGTYFALKQGGTDIPSSMLGNYKF
jgi:hypothetical protein